MKKLENNIFSKLDAIEKRLDRMEKRLDRMDQKEAIAFKTIQAQMVRIKNGEKLPDDFVLNRRSYNDMSPEKAFNVFQDKDKDFIVIDVSEKEFSSKVEMKEALHIPLEELGLRLREIPNKAASIMVISEDGTRSILACEMLNHHGFYNINNISGGYKFWPANRSQGSGNLRSA
ncbi:MAG: rhodanese-like domain-containing protein [Bacteriovoracaceae bacterium]|nr:rhodanese-like domain-containing protein [Bacteriovoracaceae bacterium]